MGKKEGRKSVKVAELNEFWNGQKNIVLCDPNILACTRCEELLEQLAQTKSNIDINQGVDIRLMTEERAKLLSEVKMKEIHFAWDRYEDKDKILPKFELFAKHSRINSHNMIVYTLVNYNTTIEQDLDRIYTLRDLGYMAYVMIYDKAHCADIYKRLQRWCNNRFIFTQCKDFRDYGKQKQIENKNQKSYQLSLLDND